MRSKMKIAKEFQIAKRHITHFQNMILDGHAIAIMGKVIVNENFDKEKSSIEEERKAEE